MSSHLTEIESAEDVVATEENDVLENAGEMRNGENESLDGNIISEILEEERAGASTPIPLANGGLGHGYKRLELEEDSKSEASEKTQKRSASPVESMGSIPDDTPSVQGSILSSPGSSVLPSVASRPGLGSPIPSFRPFDRRFQSRIASSPLNSPRPSSPAFLTGHSRHVSLASHMILDENDIDTPSPPWEVVRWTKLKKLNGQAFSELGKRQFGSPTCIAVSASIVLGTTKGLILIFDYHQNLKSIIGLGTKAVESGSVTSVAISADHSTVAGGHANGSIFSWEAAKSARPFLHIPPLDPSQLQNRTTDGHVSNVAITHLGFLGTRHTALVSANDRGMAFSHLASRGTGSLGRSIKTTRILGRYPNDTITTGKPRKPSTVLAFAPLPLGNVEQVVDDLGLTAMLTPYLLVIVSTTPIAQTQHKAARPKEVAAHGAMSGCLAWFPAVKLKVKDPITGDMVSKVKLVYCWSNVLTVLDVDVVESSDKDKPPNLFFKARNRWKAEEAIVAVQWLSRSVLTVLTITQRLIVLEDQSMRMTEGFDLIQKHIFHQDLFSKQLHNLVEQLDEEDETMHGVVADAFYMSFKAYKGRMFLLGFNDVSIGTLSNWADRLIALVEGGDYNGAIHLATSYYTGEADKLTIGLPEDTTLRHSMVRDKLVEIMSSSLKYAFAKNHDGPESDALLRELAEACFVACLSIGDIDFLFDEAFEWYDHGGDDGIFLETLEPYILDQQITGVPPGVVKALVTHYVTAGLESRLEEIIVHMETATLDLDEITILCKQHNLYDALIYVWNQALGDYITPMIDLLTLLVPLVEDGDYFSNGDLMNDPIYGVNALKMFPYMSYTFTGRRYPTSQSLEDEDARNAKAELYWFLFCGKAVTWPKGSRRKFLSRPHEQDEPPFPYLRMILKFDAPSFLSVMNEAFEDSFLNESTEATETNGSSTDLPEEQLFGLTVNRLHIVSILLEVMNRKDFAPEDTIYLDMFIARNLSKFPQYLPLKGTLLHQVLTGLCAYPGDDIAEDAQLSAEYLLSAYHPSDMSELLPLFRKAKFYRVLKSIYKADRQYANLILTFFEDPEDQDDVFDCIQDCLRPGARATKKQVSEVHEVLKQHARDLVDLDATKTAQTINAYAPSIHQNILDSLENDVENEHLYLKTILEPDVEAEGEPLGSTSTVKQNRSFVERYVQLMCSFDPSHVIDYVSLVQASDLRLDKVLPAMEVSGVVDAAVVLMAREGQIKEAMDRLTKHLGTLESALIGLLDGDSNMDVSLKEQAAEELLEGLQKYINVGIWLCQGNAKSSHRTPTVINRKKTTSLDSLSPDESLWLELIDSAVQITKSVSASISSFEVSDSVEDGEKPAELDHAKLQATLRTLVQRTFTALLSSTSSPSPSSPNISFLQILRAFLTRASVSSPNLSDLRSVLASIFSAYAYEESILSLANRLLDKDLFVNVQSATELRQRGWRPRGSLCEGCRRRVWGPGAVGNVFERWEERQDLEKTQRAEKRMALAGGDSARGKGRAHAVVDRVQAEGSGSGQDGGDAETRVSNSDGEEEQVNEPDLGPLIVMACRHIYHQVCLEKVQVEDPSGESSHDGRVFKCPMDG